MQLSCLTAIVALLVLKLHTPYSATKLYLRTSTVSPLALVIRSASLWVLSRTWGSSWCTKKNSMRRFYRLSLVWIRRIHFTCEQPLHQCTCMQQFCTSFSLWALNAGLISWRDFFHSSPHWENIDTYLMPFWKLQNTPLHVWWEVQTMHYAAFMKSLLCKQNATVSNCSIVLHGWIYSGLEQPITWYRIKDKYYICTLSTTYRRNG